MANTRYSARKRSDYNPLMHAGGTSHWNSMIKIEGEEIHLEDLQKVMQEIVEEASLDSYSGQLIVEETPSGMRSWYSVWFSGENAGRYGLEGMLNKKLDSIS